MDKVEDNPLVIMSEVQTGIDWLDDVHEIVQYKELDEALMLVAKIIAENGNVPQPKVATVCVKLEALNVVLRTRFVEYMSSKKGTKDAAAIKNMYRTVYEGIDRLVDSLKYLVRQ